MTSETNQDVMTLIDAWSRSGVNPFDVRVHSHEADLRMGRTYEKASGYLSAGASGSLRSICLNGERGSGKTTMLYMLKREAVESGRPAAFIDLSDPVFRSGGDSLDLCMYFYANVLKTFCESIQSFSDDDSEGRMEVQEFEDLLRKVLLGPDSIVNEEQMDLIKGDPSLSFLFNWLCNRSHENKSAFKAIFIDLIEEGLKQFLEYRAPGTRPVLIINGLQYAAGTGIPLILDRLNTRPASSKPWSSCQIQFVCAVQDRFVSDFLDESLGDQEILHSFYETHHQLSMPEMIKSPKSRMCIQAFLLIKESLFNCNESEALNFPDETVSLALRTVLGAGSMDQSSYRERNDQLSTRWVNGTRAVLIFELSIFFDLYQRKYKEFEDAAQDSSQSENGDPTSIQRPHFLDLNREFTERAAEHLVVRGKDPIDAYFSNNSNALAAVYLVCSILHPRLDKWIPLVLAKDLFNSAIPHGISYLFERVPFEELVVDLAKHNCLVVKSDSDPSDNPSVSDLQTNPHGYSLMSRWDSPSTSQTTASILTNRVNAHITKFLELMGDGRPEDALVSTHPEDPLVSTHPVSDAIHKLFTTIAEKLNATGVTVSSQFIRQLGSVDSSFVFSPTPESRSFAYLDALASSSPKNLSFLLDKSLLLIELKFRDDCRSHLSKRDWSLIQEPNLFFAYAFERLPARMEPELIDAVNSRFSTSDFEAESTQDCALVESIHASCITADCPDSVADPVLLSNFFRHVVFGKEEFGSIDPKKFSDLLGDLSSELVEQIISEDLSPLVFLSILTNKDGHNRLASESASLSLDALKLQLDSGATLEPEVGLDSFLRLYNFLVSCFMSKESPDPLLAKYNFDVLGVFELLLPCVFSNLNDPKGEASLVMLIPPDPSVDGSTCSFTMIENGIMLKTFADEHVTRLHPGLQKLLRVE